MCNQSLLFWKLSSVFIAIILGLVGGMGYVYALGVLQSEARQSVACKRPRYAAWRETGAWAERQPKSFGISRLE